MEQLHFTREQVSKILDAISQKEGGIQVVLKPRKHNIPLRCGFIGA